MSEALFDIGGLRFWTEQEILARDQAIGMLSQGLSKAFQALNSAWTFHRIEGPLLTPRNFINPAYDESDIFLLDAKLGEQQAALRAETTASSYLMAEIMMKRGQAKAPTCIWQVGKSFRRETNDGARAAELRFNEFYQIEFQCIYREGTTAPLRETAETVVSNVIRQITRAPAVRMVPSDRLPAYSIETRDVEVPYFHDGTYGLLSVDEVVYYDEMAAHPAAVAEAIEKGEEPPREPRSPSKRLKWKEMASISTRNDFPLPGHLVLEVAVGLDRLIMVQGTN